MNEQNGHAEIYAEMVIEIVAQRGIETRDGPQGTRSPHYAFIPDQALARVLFGLGANRRRRPRDRPPKKTIKETRPRILCLSNI